MLSTGMSPLSEIDDAVERIKSKGLPLIVMQCTSMYPTPPEKVGLNLIPFFQARYGCAVGLSDHSGTIYPSLAAVTLDVVAFEVHVTLSREMYGPDVSSSVTTSELRQLVEGVHFIKKMTINPLDKDAIAREMMPLKRSFNKSITLRTELPAGTVLREEHLTGKKPGTGIPVARMSEVIGRRLKRAVSANELLHEEYLEPI